LWVASTPKKTGRVPTFGASFLSLQAHNAVASGTLEVRTALLGRITPESTSMQRFLPQSLIFVAIHAVFIAGAIAVAALN
jgi:hypothetical protein